MLAEMKGRIKALLGRDGTERDVEDELRFHFDAHVAKLIADGATHDEALRQARLLMGSPDALKEEIHETRALHVLDVFAQDFRFSLRILAKNWKLAAIAVFSLAVAMTLGTVGLGVANGVLLRPPVSAHPEELVEITAVSPDGPDGNFAYSDYEYIRDHAQSFSTLAAFPYQVSKTHAALGEVRASAMAEVVSENYFETMGLVPAVGTFFPRGSDAARTPLAVISYAFWQRLGGDPQIVGRTLALNGHPVTIAGVAPKDFTGTVFGFGTDVMENLGAQASLADPHFFTDAQNRWLLLIGRLRPGITRASAEAEVHGLAAQLAQAHPETNKDRSAAVGTVSTLPPDQRSAARLIAGLLVGAVLLVLLIACANVANLLLGLGTGRRREILVRTALGATRGRLVRQLLTESLILCSAGGLLGFLIATAILARYARFEAMVPVIGTMDIVMNFRADAGVAFLTIVLILLASLAAGLAPAMHASVPNLAGALSGEAVIGGRGKGILRGIFVAVEVAICTLVMVGVGLCFRSVHNLENVPTGFDIEHLGGVMIDLPGNEFTDEKLPATYDRIREAAASIPGVKAVSLAIDFPLGNDSWYGEDVEIPSANGGNGAGGSTGSSAGSGTDGKPHIPRTIVDENYFATMDIPLVDGRAFVTTDTPVSPAVAIVNRKMAETYWPGASAVGKQFFLPPARDDGGAGSTNNGPALTLARGEKTPVTIVGVAENSVYNTLDEARGPVIYFSLGQHREGFVMAIVRSDDGNPQALLAPLEKKITALGIRTDLTPFTGRDIVAIALLVPSITLDVILGLGALALMLAVMGLYGAIFYSVNERRQEIGIRVALGAAPRDVLVLFLRQSALMSGLGVACGLALGAAATVALRSQLFGIGAVEVPVLATAAVAMMMVALAVAYLAARPWARVSPLDAVRHS
jgi:predicted permease